MMDVFIYLMIYVGSALMAYNIYRYICFSRDIRKHGNWDEEQRFLHLPIWLLIMFFVGYLIVGFFGTPDLVMAGILFGGSIFVFLMLLFMRRTFDRIRENEQLEVRLSAAEEASKAKTFFLSNRSHDIRTPLYSMIGYTTLFRSKFSLEPTCVNLEDCVQEACDLVRIQLEAKKIELSVSCSVSHKWVLCDKVMMDRALMNLLCNAGKFTEENGSVSLQLTELTSDNETGT